jgi:hypothetical protein
MAYPTVAAPYGLKPINLIGGQQFAGQTREIPIASGYNVDLLNGDVVKLTTDGTIVKDTGTTTATPVGVFLGVSYTSPSTKQKLFAQYWPAGTAASDAVAYVQDDPDLLMKAVAVSGTTVVTYAGENVVGLNAAFVQNTGSTTTGDSAVAITNFATTASLPARVVAIVPDSAISTQSVGSTSGSSTTVTLTAANANIYKFMDVSGTGVAAGTFVSAISGTTLTLSAAANLTGVTLSFYGSPEVIVKWNEPYAVSTTTAAGSPLAYTTTTVMTGGHQYRNPTGV